MQSKNKNNMDISELKAQHRLLKRWDYKWSPLDKGYTDKTLYVNVGTKIGRAHV